MYVKFNNLFGEYTLDLGELVHKHYPNVYEIGQELTNTDVIETDEFVFIATHLYINEDTLQRYFLITLSKGQFNKVVFSDSNCIDPDKYKTAHSVAISTERFFKHLLGKYDYKGSGKDWVQREPKREYKKFVQTI